MNIVLGVGVLILLHIMIWLTTNLQLVEGWKGTTKVWYVIIGIAIPMSLLSAYATRILYASLDSAWSIRFIGFGTSYFVFPIMTWFLLNESMFTLKTAICIALSIVILVVQLKM
mgnify:CR=1 FL=1